MTRSSRTLNHGFAYFGVLASVRHGLPPTGSAPFRMIGGHPPASVNVGFSMRLSVMVSIDLSSCSADASGCRGAHAGCTPAAKTRSVGKAGT
jgi:hypothetical protein